MTKNYSPLVKRIAQTGLVSKGIVYAIFGTLIFMAVFGRGHGPVELFDIIKYIMTFGWYGRLIVLLLTAGLLCYSTWKLLQMLLNTEGYEKNLHGYFVRVTWLGPFIFYLVLGGHAAIQLYHWYFGSFSLGAKGSPKMEDLLFTEWGRWAIGFTAFALFTNAASLFYLAFSGKYQMMLTGPRFFDNSPRMAKITGFAGYFFYGIALLITSLLFAASLYYSDRSMARGEESMFSFLMEKPYGVWLLSFIALGTICYGVYFFMASFYRWEDDKPQN